MGRGIAVLDGRPRRTRGRGGFGGFVPHFHNGKCDWVADGEMFPIRMRKLDNNVSLKTLIRGLFGDIFSIEIKVTAYVCNSASTVGAAVWGLCDDRVSRRMKLFTFGLLGRAVGATLRAADRDGAL